MTVEPPWKIVEGASADLTFVAHGGSVEAAFAAAAEALLGATVEEPDAVEACEHRTIHLGEPDLELLLLRFLNELIYLRDAEGLLLRPLRLRIERGRGVALEAELAGEPLDRDRHHPAADVKAATAHGLRVTRIDGGWETRATLDV